MRILPESKRSMEDEEFDKVPSSPEETLTTFTDASLPSAVLASMDTLRQAGQLCDCVLRVGKKLAEFTAHQAVLASLSPYFMAMFEQDPRTESLTRKTYNVKETTPEAFQVLLDYAYSGGLKLCESNVKEVYLAAVRLKFSGVTAFCSDYLMDNLNISNCIEVRRFVDSDASLVERTNRFIQDKMAAIKETKSYFSLPQINMKLLGYSRGVIGGPDSNAVAKLISDWLLTLNVQDGDTMSSGATEHTVESSAHWSAHNVAMDMQVLIEHDNVLYLDADNHLQDVSGMDECMSKTDAVQDYVKTCKKYYRGTPERSLSTHKAGDGKAVDIIAHEQINGTLHNLLVNVSATIYSMVVRIKFLPASDKYNSTESGLNRNSLYTSSASGSSAEEDEQSNGIEDSYHQSSLSSFAPLAQMNYPRCGVGLASWDGKLIAFGGNDRGECLDTVESFDPDTNRWSKLPNMGCPRGRFDGAVVGDKLYACGGSDGRRELNTLEYFDGDTWQPSSRMLSSKSSGGVGVLNNKLYIIGGYNGQRAEKSCEVYNPCTTSWSRITPLNEGRSQCAVCSYKGILYVFGGTDSWNCSSTVEVYDPVAEKWSFAKSMPQARRGAAATIFKGKIYVLGGSDGSKSLNTVDVYDCESNSWCSAPSLQTPRSNAGVAVIAGRLYIAGGYGKNSFLSDMEVLEGDNDSKWCSYHKNATLRTSSDSDADH